MHGQAPPCLQQLAADLLKGQGGQTHSQLRFGSKAPLDICVLQLAADLLTLCIAGRTGGQGSYGQGDQGSYGQDTGEQHS